MQHFLSFWASYSITWPRCKKSFVWTGSAFPQSFLSCKQSDAERKGFVDIPEQDHSWFYTSLRLFVSFVEEIASPSLLVSSNFRPCIFLRPVSNHTENLLHNLFKTWHFIIKDVGSWGEYWQAFTAASDIEGVLAIFDITLSSWCCIRPRAPCISGAAPALVVEGTRLAACTIRETSSSFLWRVDCWME